MLRSVDDLVTEFDVSASEITIWIEQNWVLPSEQDGEYHFDEDDFARVRLIAELRRDVGVNEEAMPVVLRLLDQVYGLRRALEQLNAAIRELPEDAREMLEESLRGSTEG
jgi:chaperone modulatory protein CbpM